MKYSILVLFTGLACSCSIYKSDARKILEDGAFTFRNGSLSVSQAANKHCYSDLDPEVTLDYLLPIVSPQLKNDIYQVHQKNMSGNIPSVEFIYLNYQESIVLKCSYLAPSPQGFSHEDFQKIYSISQFYVDLYK